MRPVERTLLGLLVWLPAIPFGLALGVAGLTGCALNEIAVRPGVVARIDPGLPLTPMALMGWLVIALLPAGTKHRIRLPGSAPLRRRRHSRDHRPCRLP